MTETAMPSRQESNDIAVDFVVKHTQYEKAKDTNHSDVITLPTV